MVDLDILTAMGSSQDRLKEIFTAINPSPDEDAIMNEEQREARQKDLAIRAKFEEDIRFKFSEQIYLTLGNWPMYSAVDLAWDAAPINKATVPLMLYAQGKLDVEKCAQSLKDLPDSEKYITKDQKGTATGIDLPKFFEVNFNLVRSVITRRLAAQANKYNALYPHYKYEARSTSQVAKLRGDIVSQVMDIVTDGYDLRHHDMQCARDAMLYGHCLDFVRASWEREMQYVRDDSVNPDLALKGELKLKPEITKEGLGWVNPHPTRTCVDNAYPTSSLNSDTGCNWVLFWDIVRYGDVSLNTKFWNRDNVSYSVGFINLFSAYANYFSQYYCTINPPCSLNKIDLSAQNDRLANVGIYAQNQAGSSMLLANYFRKIVPKDMGIGDYPFPVWLRMVVCGTNTVVYAEFLPSSPCCYLGINENDSRQYNISIAMELIPYQDQMSQLLSLLLLTVQSTNFRVLTVDTDSATPEMVNAFKADVQGKNRYNLVHVWAYSGNKMRELGVEPRKIIELIQTQPSQAVTQIFEAMTKLVQLAERLMALSPQELGQPAPREISATETTLIAGTTETMYGFISDAIDAFRAAKKRILYEAWQSCGSSDVRVPVLHRYPVSVIKKAGFEVLKEDDEETYSDPEAPRRHTIIGSKKALRYDYIFTSRDGALRSVNTQAANALVQLLGVVKDPMVLQKIGPSKYFEILNEIFRLSGTGVDLAVELDDSEENTFGPDQQQQIAQVLEQITANLEQERQTVAQQSQEIQKLNQTVDQLLEEIKTLAEQVQEMQGEMTGANVDPVKRAQDAQKLAIDGQIGQLDILSRQQDIQQTQESHELDLRLKKMKAMKEASASAT